MAEPLDHSTEGPVDAELGGPENGSAGTVRADSQGIGTRVSAVFTAAEKAANDMLTLAREQAEDILRKAEAEAASYASHRRSQAEEEARHVLAEAEAEAHGIRHA